MSLQRRSASAAQAPQQSTSAAGPASVATANDTEVGPVQAEATPTLDAAAGALEGEGAATPDVESGGPAPTVEKAGAKGPLTASRAKAVLSDAFKGYKAIDDGDVRVLDQADFQVAYDKIYGKGPYAWDKWVKPNHGNLNGFAYNNVNYINKSTANTGTVPHEMLHNNAASDWRPFVETQFDEGATDVLKQHALKKAGLSSPDSYPNQIACVKAFLASGVSEDDLFTAYLKGGAATIVGKHVDDNCKGTWVEVKTAMEAKDWAKAKVKLGKK